MNTEYLPTNEDPTATTNEAPIEVHDLRGINVIFIHSMLDDYGLTSNVFRLYCHLARRASNGQARASVKSMAAKCRQNEDTIRAGLIVLVEYNMISRQRRCRQTTAYTLNPVSAWSPPTNGWHLPNTESKRKRGVLTQQSQNGNEGSVKTETRGGEGNPYEGNPFKEVLPLMVSDSQDPENQEADRVGQLEQKKSAVVAMDVDKEKCTEKTENLEDVKLPDEPFELYKPNQALKWRALQLKLGADWTEEETVQAFKDLQKHRHPLTGRWRTGKTELTDFGLALSERILQNRKYQAKSVQGAQSIKEESQRVFVLETREKSLQKAIDNHPANRRSMCYVEQLVTEAEKADLAKLRSAMTRIEKARLDFVNQ